MRIAHVSTIGQTLLQLQHAQTATIVTTTAAQDHTHHVCCQHMYVLTTVSKAHCNCSTRKLRPLRLPRRHRIAHRCAAWMAILELAKDIIFEYTFQTCPPGIHSQTCPPGITFSQIRGPHTATAYQATAYWAYRNCSASLTVTITATTVAQDRTYNVCHRHTY
jgi:hypothetical protein